MTMKGLVREEIFLFGETFVASANGAAHYWTGRLLPGVEDELRDEDGKLPGWFDSMEVVAIDASDDGGLLVAVR